MGEQAGGQTEAAGGSQGPGQCLWKLKTIDSGALKPVSFAVAGEKACRNRSLGLRVFQLSPGGRGHGRKFVTAHWKVLQIQDLQRASSAIPAVSNGKSCFQKVQQRFARVCSFWLSPPLPRQHIARLLPPARRTGLWAVWSSALPPFLARLPGQLAAVTTLRALCQIPRQW